MTVVKSEFFLALNQVATERGISPDDVINSIKAAVLAAYKKDYSHQVEKPEDLELIEVNINQNNGEVHIIFNEKDITPPGFGRIAAQTARQVILQKIREAEKKTIVHQYESQIGTIMKGKIIRYDGNNATIDIGRAEAILPPQEQIKGEVYQVNDSYIVYLLEIVEDKFGNSKIIVSRSHPKLVEQLFAKEVPEIVSGTVTVKNIVRSPGDRVKIAVFSDQSGVDPVGACVGQKGIRVKAVTDQLGGDEKIDIIQFSKDDALYIREALSPASVVSVEISAPKQAKVFVTEEQAPLAIGKNGVNVFLASKLTDYEIDIRQVAEGEQKSEKPTKEDSQTAKKISSKEKHPKVKKEKKVK